MDFTAREAIVYGVVATVIICVPFSIMFLNMVTDKASVIVTAFGAILTVGGLVIVFLADSVENMREEECRVSRSLDL